MNADKDDSVLGNVSSQLRQIRWEAEFHLCHLPINLTQTNAAFYLSSVISVAH